MNLTTKRFHTNFFHSSSVPSPRIPTGEELTAFRSCPALHPGYGHRLVSGEDETTDVDEENSEVDPERDKACSRENLDEIS